jgi:hypothetical protein
VEQLRGQTAPAQRFDPRQAGISEFGRPRPIRMERGQAS